MGIERSREFAIASAFRFMSGWPTDQIAEFVNKAKSGIDQLTVAAPQRVLF
jgi:hypothetical protein